MARCPSCNKFVSVELAEPEVDVDISDYVIDGSVRLVLTCVDCSEELSEANPSLSLDVDHECNGELEIVDAIAEATDRYQNKDRNGKPITNRRYMRHYYGADVTVTVKCSICNQEFDVTGSVEEQASGFDSLC